MKERPILFSAPMVRAVLEGRKTQTRRVLQLHGVDGVQTNHDEWRFCEFHESPHRAVFQGKDVIRRIITEKCPYGVPGDRLWVRETWGVADSGGRLIDPCINYRADGVQLPLIGHADPATWSIARSAYEVNDSDLLKVKDGWRSARFMFRWASRITLEITDVRVQWVQAISEGDAASEGVQWAGNGTRHGYVHARGAFMSLWDSINAKRGFGWVVNPWVWALTFKLVTA
jgi:hypothetical protein